MPTLEHDDLVFRFPKIEADASFQINFQRTLRIPDSQGTYGRPLALGLFPCAMRMIIRRPYRPERFHWAALFCQFGKPRRSG